MKTYSFENLSCWQSARELAVWIYKVTRSFPAEERFGIISQMRRASISVASNIAEGTSRVSKKEQARFSVIAYSSAIELLNDLIIARDLAYITDEQYSQGREKIEKQTYLITKLRAYQILETKPNSFKPIKPF